MSFKGKSFRFHGAFTNRQRAANKKKSVHGFIVRRRINGDNRYVVLTKSRAR